MDSRDWPDRQLFGGATESILNLPDHLRGLVPGLVHGADGCSNSRRSRRKRAVEVTRVELVRVWLVRALLANLLPPPSMPIRGRSFTVVGHGNGPSYSSSPPKWVGRHDGGSLLWSWRSPHKAVCIWEFVDTRQPFNMASHIFLDMAGRHPYIKRTNLPANRNGLPRHGQRNDANPRTV